MRKSRVLLAGVAVAAAAAATSAFTGSNTLPTTDVVAGYGTVTATGATVTNVGYTLNATDASVVDAIVFTTSTDVTGSKVVSTLTLKKTVGGTETAVTGYPQACSTAVVAGSDWTITCDTSGSTLHFADFDLVGLTVSNAA